MTRYILGFMILAVLFLSPAAALAADAEAKATELEGSFKIGPALILIVILATFVLVGIFHRAKDTSDYWVAGRKTSPVGAGMAIASNWMSAASFLGMAAIMYGSGYHGLS